MYVYFFIYSAKKKIQRLPAFFSKRFFSNNIKKTNQCFSRRLRSRTETDQDVVVVVDVGGDAAAGDGDADDVLSAFFRPSSSSRFSPPRPGLPKQDFIRNPPPPEKKYFVKKILACSWTMKREGGRLQKLSKVHFSEWLEVKDNWCS